MSRVNFGAKPWLYPMPVLIVGTYDENGVPNAMNAAWGMISDFQEISNFFKKTFLEQYSLSTYMFRNVF